MTTTNTPAGQNTPASASAVTTPAAITDRICSAGLVAILRARSAQQFPAICDALMGAGVCVIEITLTTPGALESITSLAAHYGDGAVIGAGTVITADQAEAAIEAGATFLVSPTASPDVIATARIAGIAAYPGALTPTEILTAFRSGAPAVKLFPASAVSPRFITDLHGPCPEIPIMPTGGIEIGDIATWLHAGAAAVGLGSPLIGAATTTGVDKDLTDRARRAVAAVHDARSAR